jgi:hypothetical protein
MMGIEWVGEIGRIGEPPTFAPYLMGGVVNDRRVGVADRALGGGTEGVADGGVIMTYGFSVNPSW